MSNTGTLSGGKCQTLRALKRQQLHFYFKLQSRQKLDFQMRKLQFDAAEAQTLCVCVFYLSSAAEDEDKYDRQSYGEHVDDPEPRTLLCSA